MRIFIVLVAIILSISITSCFSGENINTGGDNSENKSSETPINDNSLKDTIEIQYKDISTTTNIILVGSLKKGDIQFLTFDPHKGGYYYTAYFKEWKKYENIDVLLENNTLKIMFIEKESEELEDTCISFNLNAKIDAENIQFYKNGDIINSDEIKFIYAIE